MRLKPAALSITVASIACTNNPQPDAEPQPVSCPNRMMATVSNPGTAEWDVRYIDASRPATTIGQVSGKSTVTFSLPGEGLGRVTVALPATGQTQAVQNSLRPRIRVHCATG